MRPTSAAPDAERVRSGVRRLLDVADGLYAAGDSGIAALDGDSRLAVRAASGIYRAIGTTIRRRGFRVLEQRARVSALEKVRLFARAALAGMMTSAVIGNPTNLDDTASGSLAIARQLLLEHGVSA